MIRPKQLRDDVIIPVLANLVELKADQSRMAQDNVIELLLGTAMQESHLGDEIAQLGGPALGLWQMEPNTEKDIWTNFLAYQTNTRVQVSRFILSGIDRTQQLAGNLYYACAMARVHYMRVPEPLPKAGDTNGQAIYYKKYYNTYGRGSVPDYLANWSRLQDAIKAEG